MKKVLLLSLIAFCLFSCNQKQATEQTLTPVRPIADANATPETVALYNRLDALLNVGIMLGHQDDLAYGMAGGGWHNEPGRSDVKECTGKYPAVFGYEIGHLEIGAEYSLDSVYFKDMKRYIREGYQMGGINIISWHSNNPSTGGGSWDCDPENNVVKSILPGGENHEKFMGWLDILADFLLDLKDDNGTLIPVIFRPFHEHTGGWFWWGAKQCSPEEYIQVFKMTADYLRDVRNVHNLLYAYSPTLVLTEEKYLERYPGDEYVDIIGFDFYANYEGQKYNPETDYPTIENYKKLMRENLDILVKYSAKAGKIPAITETGMEGFGYEHYFTEALYDIIKDYSYRISFFHFWRNSPYKARHYYAGYPGCLHEEDFIAFVNLPRILMLNDIKDTK